MVKSSKKGLIMFVKAEGKGSAIWNFTHDQYFMTSYFSSIVRAKGIPSTEEMAKFVEKDPKNKLLLHAQALIKPIKEETRKKFNVILNSVIRNSNLWATAA